MKKLFSIVFAFVLTLFISGYYGGCASTGSGEQNNSEVVQPYPEQEKEQALQEQKNKFKETMDDGIGKLTYDDAISTWGAPTKTVKGDEIIVVDWSEIQYLSTGVPVTTGVLRITFSKKKKVMLRWVMY